MDHQRKKIRQAIQQALISAGTAAGARVFATRRVPWATQQLPAISLYTDDETVSTENYPNSAPRELERTMNLAIEAAVSADTNENLDDLMDDLALQIERAMHADPQFAETASNSILASTETHVTAEGQRPMGMVRMVYQTLYYTLAPDPVDVPLVDLDTVVANYSLSGGQAPADQAQDIIQEA